MDRYKVMVEWIESTQDAITSLQVWLDHLREWWQNGGELTEGDFNAAFDRLYKAGLGDTWADTNPAGGGLDPLAAAVRGEEETPDVAELPGRELLLRAIFGEPVEEV